MEDGDLLDALSRVLSDLSPAPQGHSGFARTPRKERDFTRIGLDKRRFPSPTVLQVVLMYAGLENLGRAEKLDWEYAFVYEGVNCSISHEKFGLFAYWQSAGFAEPEQGEAFVERMMGRLVAAQKLMERHVLQPLAEEQIAMGNVTIRNQYHPLNSAYKHFRTRADAAFSSAGVPVSSEVDDADHVPEAILSAFAGLNRRMQQESEGWWNTFAMVMAYFSRLEHTLVGLLPWANFEPLADSVERFIGLRWADKYVRIFSPHDDPEAMRHLNHLREIAENWRNTYGHGGFDKAGNTLYFHLPNLGTVPASLSDVAGSPHFKFLPVDVEDFQSIISALDEFDEWTASSALSNGYKWILRGLDYRFDAAFLRESRSAQDDFEEYLAAQSYLSDRATNMDW